jgi:HTH-type transcriptional regulator / antitoxin HigA
MFFAAAQEDWQGERSTEATEKRVSMATRIDYRLKRPQKDSYLDLVQAFPLASIRSESHLRAAQGVMDQLLAQDELDEGEALYLDALSDLTAAYEDEHHAIEPASDADMLRHLMEANGVSQIELHQATDIPKSTVSEILSGKKVFSRQIIRKLAEYFGVERAVLAGNL